MSIRKKTRAGEDSNQHPDAQSEGQTPSQYFRASEAIPHTGVYRVFHAEHRVSHEVILKAGENFPRCEKCQNDVHFELMKGVSDIETDRDFIYVYEIPHPKRDGNGNDKIVA